MLATSRLLVTIRKNCTDYSANVHVISTLQEN